MRAGGGKAKGAAYEREVCGKLSKWVSNGHRDDLFWRSAMSGGRATVGKRKGKELREHAGDISATHPEGHKLTDRWYVECKRYRSLDIEAACVEGTGLLAKFWREASEQATAHEKMPMLIARQDRSRTLLIVPQSHLLTPYGTDPFWAPAKLFTCFILQFAAYEFDAVMQTQFEADPSSVNFQFLKPGELARILSSKPSKGSKTATLHIVKTKNPRVRVCVKTQKKGKRT